MVEQKSVFLSYATPDRQHVEEYYSYLIAKGIPVWMDAHSILGGQNWDFEIKKGLEKASIIVIFISSNSINRRGYVQREIRIALDQADEQLIDDIYVIPVILEENVLVPSRIKHLQYINGSLNDACERLWVSVSSQLAEIDRISVEVQVASGIRWTREFVTEIWDGLPGYDFKYEILKFDSVDLPDIRRLTVFFLGQAEGALLQQRKDRLERSSSFFNYGQPREHRQNAFEYHCREPVIRSRVLSVVYDVWLSWASAAHPNHDHLTFNFLIDPLISLGSIENIFTAPESVFRTLRRNIRRSLMSIMSQDEPLLRPRDVISGTKSWSDFENYFFTDRGLECLFAPYHVGPYACGSQVAVVPYSAIHTLLRPEISSALGLSRDGELRLNDWRF